MSETQDLLKGIPTIPGFIPTLIGTVILGLLLLFYRDFNEELRRYLVPSLVVYVLGTGLIAWVHYMLWRRTDLQPKRLAWPTFVRIVVVHIMWFVCFVWYNLYRGTL